MDTTPAPASPTTRPRRRLVHAGLGLLLVGGLVAGAAACSDDADSSSPTSSSVAGPGSKSGDQGSSGGGQGAHGELADSACDGAIELSALLFQMPQDPAEIGPFLEEQALPTVETVVAGLPDELAADGAVLRQAYTTMAETGDPSAMEDPAFLGSQAAIGEAVHHGCGFEALDVTGVDYSFEGLPDEVAAGPTSISFSDEGTEPHEIMIVRRNDDVDLTLDEVLELPEEELFASVMPVTVAWGGPGETSYTAVDLEPGTYFAICNIPIGGGEEGMPHHTAGMKQTFTVA